MKKILLFATLVLAYSCSNEDCDTTQNIGDYKTYDVVLQERSLELPAKWDKSPRNRVKTKSGSNDFMPDDYLGHSYKVIDGNGIIGDQDNTGDRVINTELILSGSQKSIISNKGYNESFNESFSYSDFDKYYEKSTTTKRFNSGFELNLKLFKIGHTSKITKIFVKERTQIQKAVYGEVDAGIKTGKHTINTSPASLQRVSSEYLDPFFLEDLYYTPMSKLLSHYGEFVLTGYFSGGRAHALYLGGYTDNITFDSAEEKMDQSISASYSWGGATAPNKPGDENSGSKPGENNNGSVGGKVGWGKDYMNVKESERKIKQLYFTFKAIGGEGIGTGNINPEKIDDYSINLDSWVKSLSTPKNQKLIEILDKGLTGINAFILEENLKQRFQDTHLDLCASNEFLVPYIEIVRIPVRLSTSGVQLYDIAPVLYTRHGDLLILQDAKVNTTSDADLLMNSNEATFNQKSKLIATEKAKYYKGIEIKSNYKKIINPRFRHPLNFRIKGLDESKMYKFYNENTEMWYMYDAKSLVAFAFWYDDYILRHYGLLDWFENLQEKPLSMVSLSKNYKIYGL